MAAPTSKIRGTFKSAAGVSLPSRIVRFLLINAPAASGGDVILHDPISTTTNGSGQIGYSADFVLVAGQYKVTVSDLDAFYISVPGDGAYHDIDDLAVSLGGNDEENLSLIVADGASISAVTQNTGSIKRTLNGDPHTRRYDLMLFGESDPTGADTTTLPQLRRWALANQPDYIVGLGDLNLPDGNPANIDAKIGQYFHDWIYNYTGAYGAGSATRRFLYAIGDGDWVGGPTGNANAVKTYFSNPGNKLYYSVTENPLFDLFVVSSATYDPDTLQNSTQYLWLQAALQASTKRFKFVFFNRPRKTSSTYTPVAPYINWPLASWGASAVFTAAGRVFEQLLDDDISYFIVGTGSNNQLSWGTTNPDSVYRYNSSGGFLKLEVTEENWIAYFVPVNGSTLNINKTTGDSTGKIAYSLRLQKHGGLVADESGVGLNFGTGPNRVADGAEVFLRYEPGKVLRFTTEAAANQFVVTYPWAQDSLFVIGDDPAYLAYWNVAQGRINQMTTPLLASYYSGSRTQLAPPTFSPLSGSETSGVAIQHTDNTVEIWYAVGDDQFQKLTGWPTDKMVYFDNKQDGALLAAVARKTGYIDSEVAVGSFLAKVTQ